MDWIIGGYLLELSIEDIRKRKLSLWFLIMGILGSILYGFGYRDLLYVVTGIIPGAILLIFSVLMPKGIGIGDGILAIIYGIVYGWMRTCVWLIAGFLMAAVFGVFCYLFQRAKSMLIPLVPFLMLAHVGMCL